MEVRRVGRRFYLDGAPYAARTTLRDAGCNWDPDAKAWWTGKADLADALAQQLRNADAGGSDDDRSDVTETVSPADPVLNGRATYRGKSYYLVAEGHSRKDGRRYAKLCSRDGKLVFWVKDFDQFAVTARYQQPKSLDGLRRFAAEAKARKDQHGCGCSCHGGPYCNCGRGFCGFHHDGCDRCGCEF